MGPPWGAFCQITLTSCSVCQHDNSWTMWDIMMKLKFLWEQDVVKSSGRVRNLLHPNVVGVRWWFNVSDLLVVFGLPQVQQQLNRLHQRNQRPTRPSTMFRSITSTTATRSTTWTYRWASTDCHNQANLTLSYRRTNSSPPSSRYYMYRDIQNWLSRICCVKICSYSLHKSFML